MAQNIKLKRSSVSGKVPTTSQLEAGEIAINTADGKLYFERDDTSIQSIVTTNAVITGSLNINGPVTASFFSGNGSQITSVVSSSFATTASFASTASFAPNFYNSNGTLTGTRTVNLSTNDLIFNNTSADFIISGSHRVSFKNLSEFTSPQVVSYNSSTGQLTAMNTSSIQNVISSSFATTAATASFIAGYAEIGIAPSGSRIAIWEDSTSIKGDSGFLYTDNSLIVNNGRTLRGGTQSWSTGTISFKIAAPVSAYGAFVTYTIFRDDASRSAFRAGTITAAWNKAGTSVVLNETTTTDFGTIPTIESNVALSGGVMFVTFAQASGLLFGVNCSINVMGL